MDIKKPVRRPTTENPPFPTPTPQTAPRLTFDFETRKEPSSQKFLKFLLWPFLIALILGIAYGSFLIFRVNRLGQEINPGLGNSTSLLKTLSEVATEKFPPLLGEEDGRINILLLGIAGEKKPGQNLTDTIIVLSLNPRERKVALLSLPRDLLVKIPGTQNIAKINSIYQVGLNENDKDPFRAVDLLKKTVSEITDLPLHYFVILNFDGFEKVIDSIGGINIISERDILDTRYPGPNYSYETFELKKGFHHLDGHTALKYVRVRHGDPEGDFGRAKRQQQVMQATKNRMFSASTWLNVFALGNLLEALGENIKTDIPPSRFGSFLNLGKKLDTQNINNFVVDAWKPTSLLRATHVTFGNAQAFGLLPRTGNWKEVREVARDIFDLRKIQRRQEEIIKEEPLIYLVNSSGNYQAGNQIQKILSESFGHKNVRLLSSKEEARERSLVFDLAENPKPFTLDEMINNLGIGLSEDNSQAELFLEEEKLRPDFLLIIGKDLENVYNMNDVSFEEWERAQEKEEDSFLKNQE